MKFILSTVLFAFSCSAFSLEKIEIQLSDNAPFSTPEDIASNILNECDLPNKQMTEVLGQLERVGYSTSTNIPAPAKNGYYLKLQIRNAVSAGNAFIGHRKFVATRATLFKNGEEMSAHTFSRDSMGGAFAGFKGSCDVLNRCAETIAKDISHWLRNQIAKAGIEPISEAKPNAVTASPETTSKP